MADLGVNLDDLGLETKSAISRAQAMHYDVVELGAVAGDVAAWNLPRSGRRHLLRHVENHGMRVASLTSDIPGTRWTDPATAEERADRTIQVVDMATDMDVRDVTVALGPVKHPETGTLSEVALEALSRVAEVAASRGRDICLRPSYGGLSQMLDVIREINVPSLKMCFDPAALVMTGNNPLADPATWIERVRLLHARDGMAGNSEQSGYECRLGDGEVDFRGIVSLMKEAEFRGAFIARRHESQDPDRELAAARDWLDSLIND